MFSGKIKCGQCGRSFVGRIKYQKDGTKIRRWSCSTAVNEGSTGCDIGRLVRDDDAMQMLKTAMRSLPVDIDAVIHNVTELALEAVLEGQTAARDNPERLRQELDRTHQKKEAVMDAYFSREISKENMISFTTRYEQQLSDLRKRLEEAQNRKDSKQDSTALRTQIHSEVTAILRGETESEVFYKNLLESLTVFKDRHMELRLKWLPLVFHFSG